MSRKAKPDEPQLSLFASPPEVAPEQPWDGKDWETLELGDEGEVVER
jgi:hypothetical protein